MKELLDTIQTGTLQAKNVEIVVQDPKYEMRAAEEFVGGGSGHPRLANPPPSSNVVDTARVLVPSSGHNTAIIHAQILLLTGTFFL